MSASGVLLVLSQDDKPSPPTPLPGDEGSQPLATPTVFDPSILPSYPEVPTLIPTATPFDEAAPFATPTAALEADAPEGDAPPPFPLPDLAAIFDRPFLNPPPYSDLFPVDARSPLDYNYSFSQAPNAMVRLTPFTDNPLVGLSGTWAAGEGYRYAQANRTFGILMDFAFPVPLALSSFFLTAQSPGSHILELYASDGTRLQADHANPWSQGFGWGLNSPALAGKTFTHARYVGYGYLGAWETTYPTTVVTDLSLSLRQPPPQPPLPSCEVTIASGRNPSYYATPFDALNASDMPPGSLSSGTAISVDMRWFVNPDVVRISSSADPFAVGRWFYAGSGNVIQTAPQQNPSCSVLTTPVIDSETARTELEQAYGVLLRNESGFAWTPDEIIQVYIGVVSTAAAFDHLSASTLSAPQRFRQIMTNGDVLPYIVLYKAVGSTNAFEIPVAFTVPNPSGSGEVSIAFGNDAANDTDNVTDGGCNTFQGTGTSSGDSPIPRTIVCNSLPITANVGIILKGAGGQTNLAFTQYLLVHELGHIFDNRTTLPGCTPTAALSCRLLNQAFQGLSSRSCPAFLRDALRIDANATPPPGTSPLLFRTTCIDVVDRRLFRVLGPLRNSATGTEIYARRDRGWGSGPATLFTDFQQHPGLVFASDLPGLILEEEAADMFLNWVYRTLSDIPVTYLAGVPGTWNGFRNQSWGTFGPNTFNGNDDSYPGDARLEWMQIVMHNIFDEKGW